MNLVPYLKAAYPVLYVLTPEESRAELAIFAATKQVKRELVVWSHTDGFFKPDPNDPQSEQVEDPIEALTKIKAEDCKGKVYVFRDLHAFMQAPKVARLIRDIAHEFKQRAKTLIILSPENKIPSGIERDVTLVEFALPSEAEITQTWDSLFQTNQKIIGVVKPDERERICQAALGLTTVEAEAAFAKAIVERANTPVKEPIATIVLREKALAVRKSGILEYYDSPASISDIGGLDNLKTWLQMRSNAFSKAAREFGLPLPRGILLAGLPGTGKSLTAKATANILGVPLIRFDVGRVFGGLVGESEKNLRLAIQTVEAVGNAVLWIDEMEKAFAGMMDSKTGDSGTSQRVFGNFITWMNEKKKPVFIVATVNRIQGLPPEMLRKVRFDEIFFVGLPSPKEREAILKIHIQKYKRNPDTFDLTEAVKLSEGHSGAELEFAIVTGLYAAYHNKRDLLAEDIEKAIRETCPLSRSKSDELQYMAKWAQDNAVNASTLSPNGHTSKEVLTGGRQLQV